MSGDSFFLLLRPTPPPRNPSPGTPLPVFVCKSRPPGPPPRKSHPRLRGAPRTPTCLLCAAVDPTPPPSFPGSHAPEHAPRPPARARARPSRPPKRRGDRSRRRPPVRKPVPSGNDGARSRGHARGAAPRGPPLPVHVSVSGGLASGATPPRGTELRGAPGSPPSFACDSGSAPAHGPRPRFRAGPRAPVS